MAMGMGYADPNLLQQQLLQSQLLQQQLMLQQMQQQQPQQASLVDTIGNKAGAALGNKAGNWLSGLFDSSAADKGPGAASQSSGGLLDWISNLTGSSAGAAPATPSIASVSAMGDLGLPPATPELVQAGFVPEQSGAQMLGGYIGSGLEGLGIGSETAGMLGSGLGYGIPIAAGLYGGYNLFNNLMDDKKDPLGGGLSGAATGAAVGSLVPGIGTLAGALVGGLGGTVLGSFGSGKDADQIARDQVRKRMKETGFLGAGEGDYNITLPDGTVFDIGKDGDNKLYNVDFSQAGVDGVVRAVDPLAAIMTGGDKKLTNDYAGYFTNASMGGADPLANARALYEKAGLDHNSAYGNVWNLFNAGKLDAARRDGYLDSLDQAFGVGAYAKTGPQAFDASKPGSGGIAPMVPPPAPQQEIQKPLQKPLAPTGSGMLAPLPNKPTTNGVGLTAGPRPQPIGMVPQVKPIDVRQQLQQLQGLGAKGQAAKPGMLAQLPQQGRGPIRLAR